MATPLNHEASRPLGLSLTQDELAGLLGGSRQRVNVELKWLEQQGLISVRPRGVEINDAAGLQTLGGSGRTRARRAAEAHLDLFLIAHCAVWAGATYHFGFTPGRPLGRGGGGDWLRRPSILPLHLPQTLSPHRGRGDCCAKETPAPSGASAHRPTIFPGTTHCRTAAVTWPRANAAWRRLLPS